MYDEARNKVIDVLVYKIFNLNVSLYYNCVDTFVHFDHDEPKEDNRLPYERGKFLLASYTMIMNVLC